MSKRQLRAAGLVVSAALVAYALSRGADLGQLERVLRVVVQALEEPVPPPPETEQP